MKDKYSDYMTQNHIHVLKNSEICHHEMIDGEKFASSPLLEPLNNLVEKFGIVYQSFSCSDELLAGAESRNEYEEAALADLRFAVENLFYKIKEVGVDGNIVEQSIIFVCFKYMVSVFIRLPSLLTDNFKDRIFEYAVKNNIL